MAYHIQFKLYFPRPCVESTDPADEGLSHASVMASETRIEREQAVAVIGAGECEYTFS